MQITHLGHSAVLVETAGARVLIDPGAFSQQWHGLTDLDAVLVTHQHPDHVDEANVGSLAAGNPRAAWHIEPAVLDLLPHAADAHRLQAGQGLRIGDIDVAAVGGEHAVIHPDIPRVGNIGLVLRESAGASFFHPGDSYAAIPDGIDVLGLPVSAPWSKLAEAIEFGRAVAAAHWFPIHEGMLNDRGRALYIGRLDALCESRLTDLTTAF